jgi:hypothetical protein
MSGGDGGVRGTHIILEIWCDGELGLTLWSGDKVGVVVVGTGGVANPAFAWVCSVDGDGGMGSVEGSSLPLLEEGLLLGG